MSKSLLHSNNLLLLIYLIKSEEGSGKTVTI